MSLLTRRSFQTQLELHSTPRRLLVAAFAAVIEREKFLLLKVLRKRLERLREALRQLSRFRQKMISSTRFSRPKLMSISQRRCARVRSVSGLDLRPRESLRSQPEWGIASLMRCAERTKSTI